MTNVVNMCKDIGKIAFSELNVGAVFESCGKMYIKYYDDDLEDTFALQIYPRDACIFHTCCAFADDELVSEKQCTITIE